jgi:uncharacterized membrane protein YfcA
MNTIVGAGSLITFPALLAVGLPPVVANVSSTLGLLPGSTSGAIGYRQELEGQKGRALRLAVSATLGGATGAGLLLALPATTFERVVPFLILAACALVALQPNLSRLLVKHRPDGAEHSVALVLFVSLVAIYGGYFGAAQGVMLIALLGIFVPEDLQRLNGLKNVLSVLVNGAAAIIFVALAPIAWLPAGLLAIGSIAGGQVGALVGRRLPPRPLRWLIIAVGTLVAGKMLIG